MTENKSADHILKKYNVFYIKRTALWILTSFSVAGILMFVLALVTDASRRDQLIVLAFIPLGWILWVFSILSVPYATRLCRRQTKQLSIPFDDQGAIPMHPTSMTFLSEDWLIASGRLYLHRNFIRSITVEVRKTARGATYTCLFHCNSGLYKITGNASDAEAIQAWHNAK